MKHWQIDEVAWASFDRTKIDPAIIPLVKAAAMVERNGTDYAIYLNNVFHNDPDFRQAADNWAVEEVQHGDALGRWSMLADPSWDYEQSFARYKAGYQVPLDVDTSVRGSLTGELIARCMVETGTSSYYTALGEDTDEPVLKQICKQIAADEYRHFKLFYDHMRRYLGRERIGVLARTKIALGRVTESEDYELAFAYHVTNEQGVAGAPAYDHKRCIALYMSKAMGCYRRPHLARGMGMIFKTIGFTPHTRIASAATSLAFWALQRRQRAFVRQLAGAGTAPRTARTRTAAVASA